MSTLLNFISGVLYRIYHFFVFQRRSLQSFLEKHFSLAFQGYASFGSAYAAIRPKLAFLFLIAIVLPFFISFLYLFFWIYRFCISPAACDPTSFFHVYGIRINTLVDCFYVLYRYSETTCFYSYTFLGELKFRYFFDFLSHTRYLDYFNWRVADIDLPNPAVVYNQFRDHIRQTPYPSFPVFPITEAFRFYLFGGHPSLTLRTETSLELQELWLEFFTEIGITIILLPYYIWWDRTDMWLLPAWELRMTYGLYIPAWFFFHVFYVSEVTDYISGWLAFIPSVSLIPSWIYIIFGAAAASFKVVFFTFFDYRNFLLTGASFTDYLSLYSSTPLNFFSRSLTIVYGLPFFIFSYFVLALSVFFLPLRVIFGELISGFCDGCFSLLTPSFTAIENLFSTNARTKELAWSSFLLEISDAWMWFFPVTYIVVFLYLLFLLIGLAWYFLYKPFFFLYALAYDISLGSLRDRSVLKQLFLDQLELFRLLFRIKLLLFSEYIAFFRLHLRMSFTALRDRDTEYLKTLGEGYEALFSQINAEIKELEEWEKRDRDACEEKSYEEHFDIIAEDQALLAAKNRSHTELGVWSTLGSSPELSISYPYLVNFVRLVIRPFGYLWLVIAVIGLLYRQAYVRLFMDGVTPNVINPILASEEVFYQDVPVTAFAITSFETWYDRWLMRWVPIYGGDIVYLPVDIAASVHNYADMILSVYRWFFVGLLVLLVTTGITWLILKTFREVLSAYWAGAALAFLYVVISVFGDVYGYTLLDYSLPFTGFLEGWIVFLDGWASDVGLTDTYEEMRTLAVERQLMIRRYFLRKFERPAHGWWRYRGVLLYGVWYFRNMYVVDFFSRPKRLHYYGYSNPVERLLVWLHRDPARVTPFKHVWSPSETYTAPLTRIRLWVIRLRKRLGGGDQDSD